MVYIRIYDWARNGYLTGWFAKTVLARAGIVINIEVGYPFYSYFKNYSLFLHDLV